MAASLPILVCGAHMSGMALNGQMLERGATLVGAVATAPCYRLFALPGAPPRPGLIRVAEGGAAIAAELWQMPEAQLGGFLHGIPSPLGLGKVQVADGSQVIGFICEGFGVATAEDITTFGGWRAWMATRQGAV